MKTSSRQWQASRLALRLLPLPALIGSAATAPLYWGGGSTGLADGTLMGPGAGLWSPGGTENWLVDSGPAYDYTAWTNGDTALLGAIGSGYTIGVTAPVAVGGISTSVFSGTGSGVVTLQGDSATAQAFTLNSGSTVNVAGGTTLRLLSNTSNALTITTSGFIKDGSGTLILDSTTVGNTNTAGVVEIRDGILRVLGDRSGILSNESLTLTSGSSVVEVGQLSSSINGLSGVQFNGFAGVAGSQIRSTGAGTSYVAWNSATDGDSGSVLLTDGGGGSRLGLVKSGAGTFTLNGSHAYTGDTVVNAGRLIAGNGAISGAVSLRNTGVFEAPAGGPQPSSVTVQNSARFVANATTELSTVKVLGGAALEFAGASAIGGSGRTLITAPGGFIVSSQGIDNAFLNRVAENFSGSIALGANSSNNLDFSSGTGANFAKARLGVWGGSYSYSGLLTPSGTTYRLGGTNAAANDLILPGSNTLTGSRSLEIGVGNTGSRLTDPANSTVSLQGSNDLAGTVTVGKFSTLELAGTGGALTGATGLTLNSGSVILRDDTVLGANSNRLPTVPVTINQGGSITLVTGTRGSTEDLGQLIPSSGETVANTNGTGLGATGTAILRFASLGTRGSTATVRFANGTSQSVRFVAAGAPALTNGIVGGWSVMGSAISNFTALNNGTTPLQSTPAILADDAAWTAVTNAGNYTIEGNFTASTAGSRSVYALRIGSTASSVVDLGATSNVVTLESGGLLLSNNNAGTLQGGTLTSGAAAAYHLFAHASAPLDTAIKTLASAISDNGSNAVTLVKAGPGLLSLTSANGHTGGTVINAGNLRIGATTDVSVLGTGPLVFDGNDTTLSVATGAGITNTRTLANPVIVNADATFSVPSGVGVASTFSGPVQLNQEATFTVSGNTNIFSGPITGSGSLRFVQGAAHTLSGSLTNNFTGPTVVGAGTLNLSKTGGATAIAGDLFIGDADAAFAVEIVNLTQDHQIADSSQINFAGGTESNAGILRLNGNRAETVGGLHSVAGHGIIENGGAAGTVSVLTVNLDQDSSFGGVFRNNAAGEGDRVLSLIKEGPGTLTLNGSASHTGPTIVEAGTLRLDGILTNSPLAVKNGATLAGNGIVTTNNQPVLFHAGSSLAPGNSAGTLTFDTGSSSLDIGPAVASTAVAVLQFELGTPAASDAVVLTRGTFAIGSGLLEWDDFGFSLLPGFGEGVYALFASPGSIEGSLGPNLSGPLGSLTGTLSLADGGSDLVLTVVPEPDVAGLILLTLLPLLHSRRRAA